MTMRPNPCEEPASSTPWAASVERRRARRVELICTSELDVGRQRAGERERRQLVEREEPDVGGLVGHGGLASDELRQEQHLPDAAQMVRAILVAASISERDQS